MLHARSSRRAGFSRQAAVVALWGLFLPTSSLSADDSPPLPSLAAVRNAYVEAITSIHSLECQYTLERILTEAERAELPANRYVAFDCELTLSGDRYAHLQVCFNSKRKAILRTWRGYDGARYSHWHESPGSLLEKHQMPTGSIGVERDASVDSLEWWENWLGRKLSSNHIELRDWSLGEQGRIIGWETAEKARCVKVDCPPRQLTGKHPQLGDTQVIAWLDPSHRFLPRRIEVIDGSSPPSKYIYVIETFETVTGHDGKAYSIPKTGMLKSPLVSTRMTTTNVTVNRPVSLATFQPKFPDKTLVQEDLPPNKPREYVVGDAAEREADEAVIIRRQSDEIRKAKQPELSESNVAAPSANPRDAESNHSGWLLRGLGIALCVTAAGMWFRSRRQRA